MTPTLLYRSASLLLILFAAAHTFGFLKFVPPSAEGVAVRDSMSRVTFRVRGSEFSYGKFYRGFGLMISAYLLFAAFVAWQLGTVARSNPQAIGPLGWAFCVTQIVSLVLGWIYFAAEPAILSAMIALCVGWASWLITVRV